MDVIKYPCSYTDAGLTNVLEKEAFGVILIS